MQQLLFYSEKQAHRHLLLRVEVNAKSPLARDRKNISSRQRARLAEPFKQCVTHPDRIQRQV